MDMRAWSLPGHRGLAGRCCEMAIAESHFVPQEMIPTLASLHSRNVCRCNCCYSHPDSPSQDALRSLNICPGWGSLAH